MPANWGDLLVSKGDIKSDELQKAIEYQQGKGGTLAGSLVKDIGENMSNKFVKMRFIDESQLTEFLSKQYNVPAINLNEFELDARVVGLIPKEVALKHRCIPVNKSGATLIVAMADPSDIYAQDDLKFLTNYNIEVVIAPEAEIIHAIEKHYKDSYEVFDDEVGFDEDIDTDTDISDAPVVKLTNLILVDAIKKNATEIIIEPLEACLNVKYRIDGVLYDIMKAPNQLKYPVIKRIKYMSDMDLDETQKPQTGNVYIILSKQEEAKIKVNTTPGILGEKVVINVTTK